MSSGSGVRATVAAADSVSDAIASFSRSAVTLAGDADQTIGRSLGAAEAERDRRRQALDRAVQELRRAEAALAACEEGCGGLQTAVADAARVEQAARESHGRSVDAVRVLIDARSRLTGQTLAFLSAVERAAPGARSAAVYRDHLKGFLATSVGDAGGPSGRAQAQQDVRKMAAVEAVIQVGLQLADAAFPPMGAGGAASSIADVVRDRGMRELARDQLASLLSNARDEASDD